MYRANPPRALSAVLSLGIVGLLGLALLLGLAVRPVSLAAERLVSVAVTLPPPPAPREQPRPVHRTTPRAKNAPSPRNLENKATPVVAPPVVQPLVVPPPIAVATQAGVGAAENTGASREPGTGQGAGGDGNGLGGGGNGGDGDGAVVGPRRIRGKLAFRDLPQGVLTLGEQASVDVRYTVNPDGRVSQCRAVRSSGFPAIDTLACRLIEQRFVFRPARNAAGKPVRVDVVESHTWVAGTG